MAKKLEFNLVGMVTASGDPQDPPGSMPVAKNCNLDAPGVLYKRTGFGRNSFGFGGPIWAVATSKQLASNLLINFGSSSFATSLRYGDGTAANTLIATPDGNQFYNLPEKRMKSAVLGQCHYITSAQSLGRLDPLYELSYAGAPRGIGFDQARLSTNVLLNAGEWLADGSQVAYRVVWGRKLTDENETEIVGAPSARRVISNTAGTTGWGVGVARDVALRVRIPKHVSTLTTALTTAWFFRLYRSLQVVTATGEPSDELQLCYEYQLTAGDIVAGFVEVVDKTPETALGAYLYTNTVSGGDVSTGAVAVQGLTQGMLAANDPPPIAGDVQQFANCMFYADLQTPMRLFASILGVSAGGGNGLQPGNVITILGNNYTAVAGAPANPQQFTVVLTGSIGFNIRQTAINLCEAINTDPTNTEFYAQYIGNDASPGTVGKIFVEYRSPGVTGTLTLTASANGDAWLPNTSTVGASGSTKYIRNGLAFSKPLQPDAVPPANYLQIGQADTNILRIVSLKEALYIFTDDGIYWLRGDSPANFVVDKFSSTFRLQARECVVVCEESIYAWGYEGIARINASGIEIIDTPVRNYVKYKAGVGGSNFPLSAFAVAYRTKRRVLFFFPADSTNRQCNEALVYNIATNAWTTYEMGTGTNCPKSCGAVRPSDDVLFLADWNSISGDAYLYPERNLGTRFDYSDNTSAGAKSAYSFVAQFSDNAPDPSQLQNWQELQVIPNVDAYNPAMTNGSVGQTQTVSVQTEQGTQQSTTFVVFSSSTPSVRFVIPQEASIGAMIRVTITNATVDSSISLSGICLVYETISQETLNV